MDNILKLRIKILRYKHLFYNIKLTNYDYHGKTKMVKNLMQLHFQKFNVLTFRCRKLIQKNSIKSYYLLLLPMMSVMG